jgi:hypothetical protein
LNNDIELTAQKFHHPVYKQHNNKNEFIAGTSIMDALMNVGDGEVHDYLFSNEKKVELIKQ